MDKLSQDAAAALAAGMSYGKWKALQAEQPTAGKPEAQEPAYGQKKRKNCIVCGKPIPDKARRWLYCSGQCSNRAKANQKKVWRDAHEESCGSAGDQNEEGTQ